MYSLMLAFSLYASYLIKTCLTAPRLHFDSTSLNQLFPFNLTPTLTSPTTPPTPSYEVFPIPHTDLSLHLTILLPLPPSALHSCLQTASLWVSYQRQSALMPGREFDWKDPAGASFYIRSLSQHLTWADLKDVLGGMKAVFEDGERYFTSSFTVEQRSTQLFVAQGRVSRYRPPEPRFTAEPEVATA